MFVSMDRDGDGTLTAAEIIEGLRVQGVQVGGRHATVGVACYSMGDHRAWLLIAMACCCL